MRTKGSPGELEHRRQLAVERCLEGYAVEEVAEFLGISPRTVWRWLAAFRDRGPQALKARPVPGRPPKLTVTQEKVALRWLRGNPIEHGFTTELWTAARLALLIEEEFGIQYHPGHVRKLLHDWGFSVQRPRRVLARADAATQDRWHRRIYPALKKKPARDAGRSSSPTKPVSGKTRRSTPPGAASGAHRKSR